MQKNLKIALYSFFSIALATGFLLTPKTTYAVSILPIDTLIQQAYLRSQESSFSAMGKNLAAGGNIYDSAYKFARKNSLETVSKTFSNVASNMNNQYGCSITAGDISTIAASDATLNASLAGLANKQTLSIDNGNLVKSCVRVYQCANGQKAGSASELINGYTQQTYVACRDIVSNAYYQTMSIISRETTLDAANRGDDMFYNGSLDDSPYDILLDMQLIGDVLFKGNTAAPQVILYDFNGGGNGGGTFFDPTGNGGTNFALGNTTSSSSSSNTTKTTNSTSTSTTSLGGTKPAGTISTSTSTTLTPVQTQALQQLGAYHQTLQQGNTTPTSTSTTSSSTKGGTTNNGLVCTTTPQNTITMTENQILTNQIAQATSLESALSTYNTAINAPLALHNALTSPEMQGNNSALTAIANLGEEPDNGNNSGNGGNNSDPNSAANSCLSKCDPLAPADKVVCEAKCLCGTKYSDNGIFGISVCTVPTYQTEVIGGKTVKSVEEIVDEINNILTALRNSGQLMKHTKTKEFLDTSLSKIKLNQILSFDMNVAFKPIFASDYTKEKKEAKKSVEIDKADRARQGDYLDSNVGQEKNKYRVLVNPIDQQMKNINLTTLDAPETLPEIDPTLPYDLAKTLNNDMINAVSEFMDKNGLLWQQVAETMNAFNTTATNLEKKIQKGN